MRGTLAVALGIETSDGATDSANPAWWTAVATGVGYAVVLFVVFTLLFLVPYAFFLAFV